MKYVIRNCPAIYKKLRLNENNALYIDEYRCNYNTLNPCQDCTDCVMKQIVELCNKIIFRSGNLILKGFSDIAVGENFVAKQVLQLLDIQEVE